MGERIKIIFLDIDGVLNAAFTHNENPKYQMCKSLVKGLNYIISKHEKDVQFVISSTWRILYSRQEIEDILKLHGFTGYLHDNWCTPQSKDAFRGDEIDMWLRSNDLNKDNCLYICLDDDTDFKDHHNLIKTDSYLGLTIYEIILSKYWLELGNVSHREIAMAANYYNNFKEHYNKKYFDKNK